MFPLQYQHDIRMGYLSHVHAGCVLLISDKIFFFVVVFKKSFLVQYIIFEGL